MTHNEKVLALLSDGEPHDHHALYALNVIAHSRVSDLRKRGHVIEMWREDDLYFYQLCSEGPCVTSHQTGSPSEPDAAEAPPSAPSEQLSFSSSTTGAERPTSLSNQRRAA